MRGNRVGYGVIGVFNVLKKRRRDSYGKKRGVEVIIGSKKRGRKGIDSLKE